MGESSGPPSFKRTKSNSDDSSSASADSHMHYWIDYDKPCLGFTDEVKEFLLSSPDVFAIHVVQFTLEFVFGWHNSWRDKLKRDDRIKFLEFPTEWLGMADASQEVRDNESRVGDKSESSSPSTCQAIPRLSALCAQRIAMELFPTLLSDIDHWFESSDLSYFTYPGPRVPVNSLLHAIISTLEENGIPQHLHLSVAEEIYVFTLVHLLFTDFRKLKREPGNRGQLKLPIPNCTQNCHGCWWHNHGMRRINDAVPDHGRGSLAKARLLPYSAFINCKDNNYYCDWSIDVVNLLFDGGSMTIEHPLAHSAALGPISATLHAYLMRSMIRDYEWAKEFVQDELIPWMKQPETVMKDIASYPFMINASKMGESLIVDHIVPLMTDRGTICGLIQDCVDAFDARNEYGYIIPREEERYSHEYYSHNKDCYNDSRLLRRFGLTGSFSKAEILHKVMLVGPLRPSIVDFEDCQNLDEDCFNAVMRVLSGAHVVLLKGTQVNENSKVIKNANNGGSYRIHFIFGPRLKNSQGGGPHIKELEMANASLLEEKASMQKQIDDLKSRVEELERAIAAPGSQSR